MQANDRSVRSALSVLILGVVTAGCATQQYGDGPHAARQFATEDDAAIRQRVAALEAAWNAHDLTAIGPVYREDAEFINVVGMDWKGREAIVKAHVAYHETSFKHTNIRTDSISVRPLTRNCAVAVWLCTMDPFTTPAGTKVPTHQNRMTMVFVKDDHAGWQVVQSQNTTIDPEAAQFDPVNRK